MHGVAVRELGRKEGVPGKDTRLTIDSRLQEYASARLAGESAAAVVMECDERQCAGAGFRTGI